MKTAICYSVIISTLLGASCSTHRATKHSQKTHLESHRIARVLEDIIHATDPNINIGVHIQSLSSNKVIFEKNAGRHFVPASTIKLVTLASALYYLGPSYRFYTYVLTDGPVSSDGTIQNLYIQGSGDPSLMDYDLLRLAQELSQRGIKKITGDIYVDDKIFDDMLWARGDMWDDRGKGYAAPVCGLNLNYNRIQIKTMPSFQNGGNARPIIQPRTSFVDVVSQARTIDGGRTLSLSVERGKAQSEVWPTATNDGLKRGDKIIIDGTISKNSDPFYSMLAVNDPGMMAATVFKEELEHLGIKVHGTVGRKVIPAQSITLAKHESRSLAEALIDFTKISNNVANDALVKAIAAQAGIKPATFSSGLKLINEFLAKEVGIDANKVITADGAGLSRYSLITPEQMVKLLNYAANHFHMGPEFIASLPIGGEDGNLRSRMTMNKLRGQVRAKSGTMSGLSNIAGYLIDEDGERYVFAIMINGFVGSAAPYISLQENILAAMLRDDQPQLANVK